MLKRLHIPRRFIGASCFLVWLPVSLSIGQNSDWVSQSPPATSANLSDVCFVDSNTLFAVGGSGIVLKSVDGGAAWLTLTTNNSNTLHGVFFANPSTGWVVGSNGTILKTTDSGDSWLLQTSGTTKILTAVHFINEQKGWAVGWDKTVLKTTDGGDHWVPQGATESLTFLEDVQFFDDNKGFAVGHGAGQVFKTDNGGQTWTPADIGAGWLKKIRFTDTLNGWAAGITALFISVSYDDFTGVSITVVGEQPTAWKTTDGGQTWNPVVFGSSGWLRDVYFSDNLKGWAAGDKGILGTTQNGGTNWTPQSNPFGSASVLNAVAANGASNVCAVGDGGVILHSTNAGTNWNIRSGSGTEYGVNACHFFNADTGWAVGNGGVVLKTTNGGAAWGLQSKGLAPYWYDVFFADPKNGWAVGSSGRLYNTTNGGESWNNQYPSWQSNINGALKTVHFVDVSTGWVAGENGVILRTVNGGSKWTAQTSGTYGALNACFFVDALRGWVAGDDGAMFKTTDGGLNWTKKGFTDQDLNSVFFLNATTGWTCGSEGGIFKTADGGETWNPQPNGRPNYLKSIFFIDANTGWAAGSGPKGLILHTADGGKTWGAQDSGLEPAQWGGSTSFNDLFFADGSTGWVVGDGGNILKTVSGGGTVYFPPNLSSPSDGAVECPRNQSLVWNPVSGAVSYDVSISYRNVVSGITGTSYSPANLYYDQTYTWCVRANYGSVKSNWSGTWSFSTVTRPVSPYLNYPNDGLGLVTSPLWLNWLAPDNFGAVTSYHVQIATDPDFTNLVLDDPSANSTMYELPSVDPGNTYYWHVRAQNAEGYSAFSETWKFMTVPDGWTMSTLFSDLKSVFFTDERNGWAVANSRISHTSDGGIFWGWQWEHPDYTRMLEAIRFTDSLTGWIVGWDGILMKTADGGISWNQIEGITQQSLYSLYFVDGMHGWICGYWGTVLATVDGGAHWVPQNSGTGSTLKKVLFTDLQHGWMCGTEFFRTVNGGETWEKVESAPASMVAVSFVSPSTGWAAVYGAIYRTTDGGLTWNRQYAAPADAICDLKDIFFPNERTGWAVGRLGVMLTTSDGGETWQSLDFAGGRDMNSVFFLDDRNGWICGKDFILRTVTGGEGTAVDGPPIASSLPFGFSLSQNFPNPFNPSTTIHFSLPRSIRVRISVFNVLGDEVAVLGDGPMSAGTHEAAWNAANMPSGIYLCRMEAGPFKTVRKMFLLK